MGADLETWQNIGRGRVVIRRDTLHGRKDEIVSGGKTFHIAEEDRRRNSELAASVDLDPFKNGVLVPVRLLDGTEDAAEIAENPNLMGETEMVALLKGNFKTLEKRVGEIRNPVVLERMLELARTEDATVGKLEAVKARLAEVAPSLAGPPESS